MEQTYCFFWINSVKRSSKWYERRKTVNETILSVNEDFKKESKTANDMGNAV